MEEATEHEFEFVPENFRRDTLEESFAALLASYKQAMAKITEQGRENNRLRDATVAQAEEVEQLRALVAGLWTEREQEQQSPTEQARRLLAAVNPTQETRNF